VSVSLEFGISALLKIDPYVLKMVLSVFKPEVRKICWTIKIGAGLVDYKRS